MRSPAALAVLVAGVTALGCGTARPAGATLTPVPQGSWRTAAPLPVSVTEIAGTALDGRVYVAGGLVPAGNGGTESTARAFVYDPAGDEWSEIAPLPDARDHAAMAALDATVYVSGGSVLSRSESYDTLFAYDPAANVWSERARMPGTRHAHAMAAIDGRLYVTAGVIGVGPAGEEVWIYDPAADAWSAAEARLPTRREHVAGIAHGGRFLVVGGRNGPNVAAVEAYDPVADAWARLPDMPTPKGALTVAVLGGALHATGGEDFTTGRTIGVHEALDLAALTWRRLPDLPSPRHGLASGAVDEGWVVVGGGLQPGAHTSDVVEVYEP